MFGIFKKQKVESLGDYQKSSSTAQSTSNNEQAGLYLISSGKTKLEVIKIIREVNPSLSLRQVKDIADGGGLVVSADSPNLVTTEQKLKTAGALVELKINAQTRECSTPDLTSDCELYLIDSGRTKMEVIKTIREINPHLGLKQAKEIADNGGVVVRTNSQTVSVARDKLQSSGAKVEIR